MQNSAPETDALFHYTSADVGVFSILAEQRLRLGPFQSTNDPRESKQRFVSMSIHVDDDDDDARAPEGFGQVSNSADLWLRRFVKVACFTRDFEMPPSALDRTARRGWAHPSQWAHYGGSHSGVCLQFSRKALVDAFVSELSPRGQILSGDVQYPFDAWPTVAGGLDLGQVREFGIDAVLSMYVEQHKEKLFFTKHHDWANEREFRLVLNEPSLLPAYLDVSGCLTGIYFGDSFPESRLDAAFEILSAMPNVDAVRLTHFNGMYHAIPSARPSPMSAVTARRPGDFPARRRELRKAEEEQQELSRIAKISTADLNSRLAVGIQHIAEKVTRMSGTEYELHPSIRAVPAAQRHRAAGLPGEVIAHEFGSLSASSGTSLDDVPRTFVFAAAVQVPEGGRLRFHGEVSQEFVTGDGNEIEVLWSNSGEADADGAESEFDLMMARLEDEVIHFEAEYRKRLS